MPRAQLDRHFSRDNDFRQALMKCPEAKRISHKIDVKVRTNGLISAGELSNLLNVPYRSLHEQQIVSAIKQSRASPQMFDGHQARVLLTHYLPRALGWKSIQDCAKEHKLHRNHIEKIVRDRGKPGDLLIAEDKRWYVSPQAEQVVLQAVIELQACADHLSPRQLADRCQVGLNLVTSYFSSRGVKIARDPLGHARLSPKQVREFEEWRIKVALREELPDKRIDGVSYRALKRVAAERAELFAPEEGEHHEKALRRCESALRHICNQAGLLAHTELGPYLPCEIADNYRKRISVPDAARIIGVSTSTIKFWRSQHLKLRPSHLPGRCALDVDLFPVMECAARKYLCEPKFLKRSSVPGQIAYFQIRALAEQLHLDWRGFMECMILSARIRERLPKQSSKLSRSTFADLQHQLSDYRYYAPKEPARGTLPSQHYSALADVLDLDALVVPAERMIQLLTSCQITRGHSGAYMYGLVRNLCGRRGLYPPDLFSLYQCKQLNMRITPFPILAAIFLETATSGSGACHHCVPPPKGLSQGDLIVDPLKRDFGVVTAVHRRFRETVATISMRRSAAPVELELSSRAS